MVRDSVLASQFPYGLVLLGLFGFVFGEHASPVPGKRPAKGLRNGGAASSEFRKNMKEAIDEALGVGHGIDQRGLEDIRRTIEPMWASLAKNQHKRVDRASLRYIAQRFFLRMHGLSIYGLEASHANSTASEAGLLTTFAPDYVRGLVEGHEARNGFLIEDAVAMIAALKRLVENSNSHVLEEVYHAQHRDYRQDVSREVMVEIMEGYMLRWMLGGDNESVEMLDNNPTLREASFEDWKHLAKYSYGRIKSFEHTREHATMPGSHNSAWNVFTPHFSFADAQAMVGGISLTFGNYWETECENVKSSLMKMDRSNSGRVKLSDFHGAALNGEWRFSESKEYLRQLGALDETSLWHGPRLIITNYLQSPSNCIVSAEHFRVCCTNQCESHLGEIEAAVNAPSAMPEEILPVIENLDAGMDDEPRLTNALKSQLKEIARSNSGKVPIHGRLFSQWLHYVFPLECPFPHKSGTTSVLGPGAFGDNYMASEAEMALHVEGQGADMSGADNRSSDDEEMSQWSHDEELLSDLSPGPWEADFSTSVLGLMCIAVISAFLVKAGVVSPGSSKAIGILPTHGGVMKSHYV